MFALQIEMSKGLFINVYLVTQQKNIGQESIYLGNGTSL